MLNNDFFNNPETLKFVTSTQHELVKFKKIASLNRLGKTLSKSQNNSDNARKSSDSNADSNQNSEVLKIKEFFDKNEKYNEKVEEVKKKVYAEGYRKPPKKYQFKKGQSGNPKGRPPKRQVLTVLDGIYKTLYKIVETNQNGKKEMRPLFEVLGETVAIDAVKKDGFSRKYLLSNPTFTNYNFMEPLIEEAIAKIPGKPEPKFNEKMKKLLYQTIAENSVEGEF